jgi:hypothetical protein
MTNKKHTSLGNLYNMKWQAGKQNIISLRAKHTNTEASYTEFHLDKNYTIIRNRTKQICSY